MAVTVVLVNRVKMETITVRGSSCYPTYPANIARTMSINSTAYAYDSDPSTGTNLLRTGVVSGDGGPSFYFTLTGFPSIPQALVSVNLTLVYRMSTLSFQAGNDWENLYYTTNGSTYTLLDSLSASVKDTGIKTKTLSLPISTDISKVSFYMEGHHIWSGNQTNLCFYDAKLDVTYYT